MQYQVELLNRLLLKNFSVLIGNEFRCSTLKNYISQTSNVCEKILALINTRHYNFQLHTSSMCLAELCTNYKLNFILLYDTLTAFHTALVHHQSSTLLITEHSFKSMTQKLRLFLQILYLQQ